MLKGNYRIPSAWELGSTKAISGIKREPGNGKRMGIMDPNDDGKGGLAFEWGSSLHSEYGDSDWNRNTTFLTIDRNSNGDFWKFGSSNEVISTSSRDEVNGKLCVMP